MTPPPQPTSAGTRSSNNLKFSKKRLVLAFVIAGISDAIGAFVTLLPAIPGLGVLPFWLLVVGAIAVLGTPRPSFQRH
jgi:VIT1/CCC1 family predicted Fe2+/Mn2+ transporter